MPKKDFVLYGSSDLDGGDFFKDKFFNHCMYQAMGKTYKTEIYDFLKEMHELREKQSGKDKYSDAVLKGKLNEVFKKYIDDGSKKEVNVSDKCKRKMQEKMKKEDFDGFTLDDFDEAEIDVRDLLVKALELPVMLKEKLKVKRDELQKEFGKSGVFSRFFGLAPSKDKLDKMLSILDRSEKADKQVGRFFRELDSVGGAKFLLMSEAKPLKSKPSKPWYSEVVEFFKRSSREPSAPKTPQTPKTTAEKPKGSAVPKASQGEKFADIRREIDSRRKNPSSDEASPVSMAPGLSSAEPVSPSKPAVQSQPVPPAAAPAPGSFGPRPGLGVPPIASSPPSAGSQSAAPASKTPEIASSGIPRISRGEAKNQAIISGSAKPELAIPLSRRDLQQVPGSPNSGSRPDKQSAGSAKTPNPTSDDSVSSRPRRKP